VLLLTVPARAEERPAFQTTAPVAVLVDLDAGMTLLDKGGGNPIEPAAMAKMMTVAVVADAIASGETSLATEYPVSEDAWRRGGAPSGGATMFAALKSRIAVSDLLRGAMIQAANDACLILAEGLAGSEPAFVERMNARAAELGMAKTRFTNATGFQDPGQKTTARDLVRLARHLIEERPEVYRIYAEKEFTWNRIRQLNRNPLLVQDLGADGLATGASESAGYGLAASAVRDGRRLLLVMHGLPSAKDRAEEAKKLMDWGFGAFAPRELFAAGETVGTARVFGGASWSVELVSKKPVVIPVRTDAEDDLSARIVYDGPVPAPVNSGDAIGTLGISRKGTPPMRVPLHARTDVAKGGMASRALGGLYEITIGLVLPPARP
jgi:D-alanyl-D-alanine carboxypeptidase (penicillin-binding protein 5/6)